MTEHSTVVDNREFHAEEHKMEVLSENNKEAYIVGTLSIDQDGIWHCSYIGHHKVGKKEYFGNGVESSRNIRELFNIVGSRLNNKKSVYTEKIEEIENAKLESEQSTSPSGTGL